MEYALIMRIRPRSLVVMTENQELFISVKSHSATSNKRHFLCLQETFCRFCSGFIEINVKRPVNVT